MQLNMKNYFVDESGYVVPNPTFTTRINQAFIGAFYLQADLKFAISEMNRKQEERRDVNRPTLW